WPHVGGRVSGCARRSISLAVALQRRFYGTGMAGDDARAGQCSGRFARSGRLRIIATRGQSPGLFLGICLSLAESRVLAGARCLPSCVNRWVAAPIALAACLLW